MGSLIGLTCQQFKRYTPYILIQTLCFFACTLNLFSEGNPNIPDKVTTVVIDAGHGGEDPGAMGQSAKEKDINLGIALKLGKYIEENLKDVKVIYTRDKDVFIPAGTSIGYDPEEDAKRFSISPGGVVVIPKGAEVR